MAGVLFVIAFFSRVFIHIVRKVSALLYFILSASILLGLTPSVFSPLSLTKPFLTLSSFSRSLFKSKVQKVRGSELVGESQVYTHRHRLMKQSRTDRQRHLPLTVFMFFTCQPKPSGAWIVCTPSHQGAGKYFIGAPYFLASCWPRELVLESLRRFPLESRLMAGHI